MRPTVTTDKDINLSQLDAELGGHGLCADLNDSQAKIVSVADESPVTQEQLQAAVDAHVAVFPPDPPSYESLVQAVDALIVAALEA